LQLHGVPQDARVFHRFGPLRTLRQRAGFFEGCRRFGFQIQSGPQVLDRSSHAMGTILLGLFPGGLSANAAAPARQRPVRLHSFKGFGSLDPGFGVRAFRALVAATLETLGSVSTAAVFNRIWQLGQRGRWIGNSSGSGLVVPGMTGKVIPLQIPCLSRSRPKIEITIPVQNAG
jgi:hypothetical protein